MPYNTMNCNIVCFCWYLLDVNVLVFTLRPEAARIIEKIVAKNHYEVLTITTTATIKFLILLLYVTNDVKCIVMIYKLRMNDE